MASPYEYTLSQTPTNDNSKKPATKYYIGCSVQMHFEADDGQLTGTVPGTVTLINPKTLIMRVTFADGTYLDDIERNDPDLRLTLSASAGKSGAWKPTVAADAKLTQDETMRENDYSHTDQISSSVDLRLLSDGESEREAIAKAAAGKEANKEAKKERSQNCHSAADQISSCTDNILHKLMGATPVCKAFSCEEEKRIADRATEEKREDRRQFHAAKVMEKLVLHLEADQRNADKAVADAAAEMQRWHQEEAEEKRRRFHAGQVIEKIVKSLEADKRNADRQRSARAAEEKRRERTDVSFMQQK